MQQLSDKIPLTDPASGFCFEDEQDAAAPEGNQIVLQNDRDEEIIEDYDSENIDPNKIQTLVRSNEEEDLNKPVLHEP